MFIELTKIHIDDNRICQDSIHLDIRAIDAFYKKDLSYFIHYGNDYMIEITKESYDKLLNVDIDNNE